MFISDNSSTVLKLAMEISISVLTPMAKLWRSVTV